jgi:hypothetical protein
LHPTGIGGLTREVQALKIVGIYGSIYPLYGDSRVGLELLFPLREAA